MFHYANMVEIDGNNIFFTDFGKATNKNKIVELN